MNAFKLAFSAALALAACGCASPGAVRAGSTSGQDPERIDREVRRAMAGTGARGIAVAVIDDGKVVHAAAYGERNAGGAPLQTDTIMYAASLTKVAFTYMVMQLVDEGAIDLDRSIVEYLPRPLPDYSEPEVADRYARWTDLAGDERWRRLTPRMLLTHSSGFANFGFLEPDGRLKIHFEPGSRYSYSGDGFILLQFVLEQGLKLDVGQEMQRRVFDPLGMTRTSMAWRPDFAANLADGWRLDGTAEPHDERSAPRAAGSMDTTIADFARFAAAFAEGRGISRSARAALVRPTLPIGTASQFPVLQPEPAEPKRRRDLAAGLGLLVFDGPQGRAFMRGGHNDSTGNIWVCIEGSRRCAVILSNDVRAEAAFPHLVAFLLGDTGAPWSWIYGDLEFWRP